MKIPLKNYHKNFCQKEIVKLDNLNLSGLFRIMKPGRKVFWLI